MLALPLRSGSATGPAKRSVASQSGTDARGTKRVDGRPPSAIAVGRWEAIFRTTAGRRCRYSPI